MARVRPPAWATSAVALFLLLIGAVLAFAPLLNGYFLADDFYWVQDFGHFDWSRTPNLFVGQWAKSLENEYRPLWALSFAADLWLWGPNPTALHLTNLAVHGAVSMMVWYLARSLPVSGRAAGLFALAFFIVAPVHVQPVGWISARGHVLVTALILLAVILFRQARTSGRATPYLLSFFVAVAAFATQEISVALPAILVISDVAGYREPVSPRLRAAIHMHVPFWCLLLVYLLGRIALFGELGRGANPLSLVDVVAITVRSAGRVWTSGAPSTEVSRSISAIVAGAALALAALPALLVKHRRADSARLAICFGVAWPLVATAPLFGANAQRHFYLASVGVAIALGYGATTLLEGNRRARVVTAALLTVVLTAWGPRLIQGVETLAESGRLSGQLQGEIRAATDRMAGNTALVVIPDLPDGRALFREYAFPRAFQPPFVTRPVPGIAIASFASCHCEPDEWRRVYSADLDRILADPGSMPIYVVEWDSSVGAFVTRAFDAAGFRNAGYATADSPLLRPRRPGLPSLATGPDPATQRAE